jgi:TonB-like protein
MLDYKTMLVRRHLGILLAAGLLSLADTRLSYPQEPKPDDPQAKKPPRLILKSAPSNSAGDSAPPKIEQLSDLASRLLHYTGDAGCQKGACKVLVTDFVFPDGTTVPNGVQWADELALLFADQKNSIQVIDRSLFKDFWEKARISAKLQNSEPVARCSILPPFPDTIDGEKVYHAGTQGVSVPICYYTPNPPSTEASRRANFSGTLLIEGVVGVDGTMRALRIVQGAPFGLNETALETFKSWKCKPATFEGKPVATIVPIEEKIQTSPQH